MMKMMMMMMVMMMMVTSEASTIEQVCKGTPDYNLCVSLLKSDPRGATADTAGLALILVDKIKTSEANIIEQVCKGTPDYNLCVSLLKSDPRGATADTTGLALILVDKIKGVAKTTVNQINGLYKTKPELKQALDECSESYNAILTADVPEAIEALTKGNPKFAEDGVVDAGAEASTCENAFKGKSPLTSLTSSLQKISDVARAIVRMLL